MPVIVFSTKCYRNGKKTLLPLEGVQLQHFMIFSKKLLFIINVKIHFVNIQTTLLVSPKHSNKAPTIDVLRY